MAALGGRCRSRAYPRGHLPVNTGDLALGIIGIVFLLLLCWGVFEWLESKTHL